jgi:hypothetical protein
MTDLFGNAIEPKSKPRRVRTSPEPKPAREIDYIAGTEADRRPDSKPERPCFNCGSRLFWIRPDAGGYVCYRCYPPAPRTNHAGLYLAAHGYWIGTFLSGTPAAKRYGIRIEPDAPAERIEAA